MYKIGDIIISKKGEYVVIYAIDNRFYHYFSPITLSFQSIVTTEIKSCLSIYDETAKLIYLNNFQIESFEYYMKGIKTV